MSNEAAVMQTTIPDATAIDQYQPDDAVLRPGIGQMRPNRRTNGNGVQCEETRICVVMVGLPARGKSLLASKGMKRVQILLKCNLC